MKRIGYQFEYGKYLSVKVPGGKWYHELDKLDERFSEEKFRFYLDMPFTRPVFVVGNTVAIHKRGITDFQMKYYRRIYQARMVEQRRFDKYSAYLARELERMNQLQEQYLFLVNNNIKTVEGLVTYQVLGERHVEKISERQQELYQQNRARKRVCKTEEDIRDYQIWHMGVQAELDELKAEKKALNKNLRIAEECVEEYKKFSMLDFSNIEDEIRNSIEVPEYPYAEEKDTALSVNDAVSDIDTDGISVMDESEDYGTSLGVEVCEQISAEDTMDATVGVGSEANNVEKYVGDRSNNKGGYEVYKKMTPLEKPQTYGFGELKSYDTVRSIVKMKFLDMGHMADVDELLEETDLLYKGMCELVVKNKTEEVLDEIKQRGIAFDDLSVIEKARMLQFQPDNNSYNIQLYSAVCKACGVDTSDEDKIFEDYQAIYEKTLEMEQEQVMGRKDGGRGTIGVPCVIGREQKIIVASPYFCTPFRDIIKNV